MSVDKIYNKALSAGCCVRCALRYTKQADNLEYPPDPDPDINFKISTGHRKRIRRLACVVCLGLLEEPFICSVLENKKWQRIKKIPAVNFQLGIQYSYSARVREKSMILHLKDMFPETFVELDVIPIHRALRCSIYKRLEQIIDKKSDQESRFSINIETFYELEYEEKKVATLLSDDTKRKRRISKGDVVNNLKMCSEEHFRSLISVPPKPSLEAIQLTDIKCNIVTSRLIGRYCKYVRNLYQNSNDGGATSDNTVESIILKAFKQIVGETFITFKPWGHELFEVRVLGKGRFFAIEMMDHNGILAPATIQLVEDLIRNSGVISVNELKVFNRIVVAAYLHDEENKSILYRVLCRWKTPVKVPVEKIITKINVIKSIRVEQTTPIRMLHIREFAPSRYKTVHTITASTIEGYGEDLLQIDILCQSGFYIPEFIHGDLGRTKPSLAELLNINIDYIAMDVLDFILVN